MLHISFSCSLFRTKTWPVYSLQYALYPGGAHQQAPPVSLHATVRPPAQHAQHRQSMPGPGHGHGPPAPTMPRPHAPRPLQHHPGLTPRRPLSYPPPSTQHAGTPPTSASLQYLPATPGMHPPPPPKQHHHAQGGPLAQGADGAPISPTRADHRHSAPHVVKQMSLPQVRLVLPMCLRIGATCSCFFRARFSFRH